MAAAALIYHCGTVDLIGSAANAMIRLLHSNCFALKEQVLHNILYLSETFPVVFMSLH